MLTVYYLFSYGLALDNGLDSGLFCVSLILG
jgi:hypothetical protein